MDSLLIRSDGSPHNKKPKLMFATCDISPIRISDRTESKNRVFSSDEIVQYVEDLVEEVNSIMQLNPAVIRMLLSYCKWDKSLLTDKFYTDPEQLFKKARVVNPFAVVISSHSTAESEYDKCEICFSQLLSTTTATNACVHRFCTSCWSEYLNIKIMDGGLCDRILCAASHCYVIVDDQIIIELVDDLRAKRRYQLSVANNLVQHNNQNWVQDCIEKLNKGRLMKRALRSAASKDDAENQPPTKSMKPTIANSVPRTTRRKATVHKENKENVTKPTKNTKNNRKNVVQPLQEQNSVVLDERNLKASKPSSLIRTTEPESLASGIMENTTNDSKRKVRTKSVDNVKHVEESVAATKPQTVKSDPPKPRRVTATKNPVVSSITTRNKRQPKVDAPEKLPVAPVQEVVASPAKRTLRNLDQPKSTGAKSPTKKAVLPSAIKTQSVEAPIPIVKPMRRTRRKLSQQSSPVVKTPTKKSAVASTRSAMRADKVKMSHASNVTVRRNVVKPAEPLLHENMEPTLSAQPDTDSTECVATGKRSNRNQPVKSKAEKIDKPETKEPVISNITTRRRAIVPTVPNGKPNEVKAANETISTTKKSSQSVPRVIKETVKATSSNVQGIEALPIPVTQSKVSRNSDPKIDQNVTKQPELSVNRSTASDLSDNSNGSTLPIYKRAGNSNNNTVNSVFDFESNSQDNTVDNDEQTQELFAKLVRDKKVSVIKRKPNGQKGVTKAKSEAARSKKIEKIRSDLKELQQLNGLNRKVTARAVDRTKTISKLQAKTPLVENFSTNEMPDLPDNTNSFDLVVMQQPDKAATKPQSEKGPPKCDDNKIRSTPTTKVGSVNARPTQEKAKLTKPFIPSATSSNATPPRQFQTYQATGSKKSDALYQSTPVRTAPTGNASPWRYNANEAKHPSGVFSRYTALEKSPIKSVEITKVSTSAAAEPNSPKKKQRPELATKSVSTKLPEVMKPVNSLTHDLRNGFGFFDDVGEESDDECLPRQSLPPVDTSMNLMRNISPKKRATEEVCAPKPKPFFRLPAALNSIRDTVKSLTNRRKDMCNKPTGNELKKNSPKKSAATTKEERTPRTTKIFDEPTTTTVPLSSFFKSRNMTTNEKTVGGRAPLPETSSSYIDTDGASLFETTWPETENRAHRSYSKVTKRVPNKRQQENKNIMTDDESEFGDAVVPKRGKRTKQKDDKLEEELRQYEEKTNSEFMDVDKFEMVMEKSVSSSIV